jgi:hypothetical protein
MGTIAEAFYAKGGDPNYSVAGFEAYNVKDTPFVNGVSAWGREAGVYGRAGGAPVPINARAGVVGTSRDEAGVRGTSFNSFGVYGVSGDPTRVPNYYAGVFGGAEVWPGVAGYSKQNDGVVAASFTGTALLAVSFYGPSVYSLSGALTGVNGISGTEGPPVPMNIATTAGVVGTSDQRPGVIGTSEALMGVYGFSTGNAGVVGQSANPNSFGGFFAGNVMVTGNLTVVGTKSAAVPFPDGTQRVLYCMESPELWFEDFGAAKLKGGAPCSGSMPTSQKWWRPATIGCFSCPPAIAAGSMSVEGWPRASTCERLVPASRTSRSPIASSRGARTSRRTGASPKSTRACLSPPRRRAHRASERRARQRCARLSPAWRRKHGSAQRSAKKGRRSRRLRDHARLGSIKSGKRAGEQTQLAERRRKRSSGDPALPGAYALWALSATISPGHRETYPALS